LTARICHSVSLAFKAHKKGDMNIALFIA